MAGTFSHNGTYICECGKVFTNSQAFNGHKSNCRIHLGDEKYFAKLERDKNNLLKGSRILSNRSKEIGR